jgi:hypothetical protein
MVHIRSYISIYHNMVGACVSGAGCVHEEERVGCLMAGVEWRGMGLHGVVWRSMVWHGVA